MLLFIILLLIGWAYIGVLISGTKPEVKHYTFTGRIIRDSKKVGEDTTR
jgi:uncharacterized membrane protein YdfJ with MMPL/SSD domain